jgi:hypothetical protein
MVWSTTKVLTPSCRDQQIGTALLVWWVNSAEEGELIVTQTELLLTPGNGSYPIGALCCVFAIDHDADRLLQMSISDHKAALYPPAKYCSKIIYKASHRIPPFKARKGQRQSIR